MRPAAGLLGVVATPLRGAFLSGSSSGRARKVSCLHTIAETRRKEGVQAARQSTLNQRNDVLQRWAELKATVEERKRRWKEDALRVLEEENQDGEVEFGQAAAALDTHSEPTSLDARGKSPWGATAITPDSVTPPPVQDDGVPHEKRGRNVLRKRRHEKYGE